MRNPFSFLQSIYHLIKEIKTRTDVEMGQLEFKIPIVSNSLRPFLRNISVIKLMLATIIP